MSILMKLAVSQLDIIIRKIELIILIIEYYNVLLTVMLYYRFRISAVYSNEDNLQGYTSKFLLQRGADLPLPPPPTPVLNRTEAVNTTAIRLYWDVSIKLIDYCYHPGVTAFAPFKILLQFALSAFDTIYIFTLICYCIRS